MRMVAFTYDTLPTVDGDPIQLAQLFQNLISKALKFKGAAPPGIDSAARRDGDFWIFSVKDNGIGVDPQFFDRIFVIFQRLHPRELGHAEKRLRSTKSQETRPPSIGANQMNGFFRKPGNFCAIRLFYWL